MSNAGVYKIPFSPPLGGGKEIKDPRGGEGKGKEKGRGRKKKKEKENVVNLKRIERVKNERGRDRAFLNTNPTKIA